jgi:hypothetical protein
VNNCDCDLWVAKLQGLCLRQLGLENTNTIWDRKYNQIEITQGLFPPIPGQNSGWFQIGSKIARSWKRRLEPGLARHCWT